MRPERAGPVAGIVLAAGPSTRMGENKLLLRFNGETVLARTVRRAAAAGLDPVVVVLGHEAERVRAELSGLPCLPVANPDYARGLNASARVGIAAKERIQRCKLAALALFAHPHSFVGVVSTRTMEKKENVVATVRILEIKAGNALGSDCEERGISRSRGFCGIRKIR